ncbi:hypothetical protein PROFUN_08147 [Planoprotostelium fungivorum]|uniref:F-box domain-containing protein n=1 Tax=Planoprotostelium fungivorum TaxID=1890364 RepID=A0A2P6MQH6_9EUKA|nr:hypothetical protein PROFUN_08147 [Planoprotostelium fungivorum]
MEPSECAAPIPLDIWNIILPHLASTDLCPLSFTSTSLRDIVVSIMDSRSKNWRQCTILLPIYNVEIAQWWMDNIRSPMQIEVKEAARTDRLEVINLIGWSEREYSHYHQIMVRLNLQGDVRVYRGWSNYFILAHACDAGSDRVVEACLERGLHFNTWSYKEQDERSSFQFLQLITRGGRIDVLIKVSSGYRTNHRSFWNEIIEGAIEGTHTDILSWVRANAPDGLIAIVEGQMYRIALRKNKMDVLDWLETTGVPIHPYMSGLEADLCQAAALSGKVESMQWAREREFTWGFSFSSACHSGSLEMVEYCVENGCPHGGKIGWTTLSHDKPGIIEVVAWLYERDQIQSASNLPLPFIAKCFPLVLWLHDRGQTVTDPAMAAILHDRVDILEWSVDNNYPFTMDHIKCVCYYGSPCMMDFLWQNRRENSMKIDIEQCHDSMMKSFSNIERFNVPVYIWLLVKKWRLEEETVRTWFDVEPEEMKKKWLVKMWERGEKRNDSFTKRYVEGYSVQRPLRKITVHDNFEIFPLRFNDFHLVDRFHPGLRSLDKLEEINGAPTSSISHLPRSLRRAYLNHYGPQVKCPPCTSLRPSPARGDGFGSEGAARNVVDATEAGLSGLYPKLHRTALQDDDFVVNFIQTKI